MLVICVYLILLIPLLNTDPLVSICSWTLLELWIQEANDSRETWCSAVTLHLKYAANPERGIVKAATFKSWHPVYDRRRPSCSIIVK